jgi:hypothetical protein
MPLALPQREYTNGGYSRRNGIETIHIKGIHNSMAEAIFCIDYSPVHIQRDTWMTFTQCWCYYASNTTSQQPAKQPDFINLVFANCSKDDVIYSLTVKEISEAQQIS